MQSWDHSLGLPGCSRSESRWASEHAPDCQGLSKTAQATQGAGETGTSSASPLLQQGKNKKAFSNCSLPAILFPRKSCLDALRVLRASHSWGLAWGRPPLDAGPDILAPGEGLAGFRVLLRSRPPQTWTSHWLPNHGQQGPPSSFLDLSPISFTTILPLNVSAPAPPTHMEHVPISSLSPAAPPLARQASPESWLLPCYPGVSAQRSAPQGSRTALAKEGPLTSSLFPSLITT